MKGGILSVLPGKRIRIKSVLFDMDGVIVDSEHLWLAAFNETLKKFGNNPITWKIYKERYYNAGSVRETIRMFREDFSNPRLGEDAVKFSNDKFSEIAMDSRLFPKAAEVLEKTKSVFKTALVSNTKKTDVFRLLKKFDIEKYFDVVVTIDDVSNGKPDPEIVLKACKILKTRPGNAVIVGDTNADIRSGMSAGCHVIGVGGIKADVMIRSIAELPEVFDFPAGRLARVRKAVAKRIKE